MRWWGHVAGSVTLGGVVAFLITVTRHVVWPDAVAGFVVWCGAWWALVGIVSAVEQRSRGRRRK